MFSIAKAEEKDRVQRVVVLATTSLDAFPFLSAGGLHRHFGWNLFIFAGCVPVVIFTCGLGWLGLHQGDFVVQVMNWAYFRENSHVQLDKIVNCFYYGNSNPSSRVMYALKKWSWDFPRPSLGRNRTTNTLKRLWAKRKPKSTLDINKKFKIIENNGKCDPNGYSEFLYWKL